MAFEGEVPPQGGKPRPPNSHQAASVRSTLVWLVLACLLPGMAGSAAILYVSYRSERATLERDTVQTARALMQAVDAELSKAEVTARAMATSGHLSTRNFAAFHAQGTALLGQTGIGNNFVLSDATGQQLVNTVRPFPGPLPRHGNPEQLRRVFDSAKPVIADIYIGGVLRRPVMSIDVPVIEDGRVVYDLSIGLFPEHLGKIPRAQQLPSEWVVSILDTQGVVAARSQAAERFVGRKAVPALVKAVAEDAEGLVQTETLEGTPVTAAFSRSPSSGWAVAIGIPRETLAAELRHRFLLLLGIVVVLLTAGLAVASFLADRIARSIRALSAPALALGLGEPVVVAQDHLREVEEVGAAIATASTLLARRTKELEAASKELEDFSYAISHDLTTPLRSIAGYARIVAADHAGQLDEEGRQLLQRVCDGTVRMGTLIDRLVDFIGIARRRLDYSEVDLEPMLRAAFGEQCALAPGRRLHLDLAGLPVAWGDRAMLYRVVENLIGNAVKFIPADRDGIIVARGEIAEGETIYHLTDNGVGFDMRYAEKLFQPFQRLHRQADFEGLGLGLAVVKRIVGRHGGRVWAEGLEGEGATLHFSLPARPPAYGE